MMISPAPMTRPKPLPRIAVRRDFLAAAASGVRAAQPGLVLQARPTGAQGLRIGFTVTRKVGNAVVRNRARRRLRAAADMVLRAAPPPGWDLVLIGRGGTLDRPFALLCEDLRRALVRAGVAA
jgi:ribonuclease P protein component